MAPHVLIIGLGDLGNAVAQELVQQNIQVTGVKRSSAETPDFTIINADVTQPSSLIPLSDLKPHIIVYCVAAGGQTDAQYKAIYVDGLNNVLKTQASNSNLKHVFFVSSTRVYGQHTDQLLDETAAAIPSDFGGERLLEGEQLLAKQASGLYQYTILRLSGIYGPGRIRMIRLAETAQWPEYDSWSNRIHRDDAASFISYLIQKVFTGESVAEHYIVTDNQPVRQYEVLGWIAKQLHVAIPEVSKQQSTAGLSGKRLSNAALRASGYKLQYPNYQAGYSALMANLEAKVTHD
jgi:nucleoside-diphosphate-sugar epimerase